MQSDPIWCDLIFLKLQIMHPSRSQSYFSQPDLQYAATHNSGSAGFGPHDILFWTIMPSDPSHLPILVLSWDPHSGN